MQFVELVSKCTVMLTFVPHVAFLLHAHEFIGRNYSKGKKERKKKKIDIKKIRNKHHASMLTLASMAYKGERKEKKKRKREETC